MRNRMKYNSITSKLGKLTVIETDYINIITSYKTDHNKKVIASPFLFIPPEINAAFGITTLKIPDFILNKTESADNLKSLYDAVVISDKTCFCNRIISPDSSYIFKTPEGFGEDASVSLHNEIMLMLKELFNIDIKSISIETLQRETALYERLRRLIRNISALRTENRFLLDTSELSLIFETALILPPETAITYITPVLEEMQKINEKDETFKIKGMLYGGRKIPSDIADIIEENGILLIEDDSCTGRRLFDISLNAESDYIFYELLDAYSYRPLTPCLRPVNERYELLYKLLKNYNIETVIFYKDDNCGESGDAIEYLRIKMMRDGIDPIVIDKDNYKEIVAGYVSRIGI
jgi:benzoyl-CoA reductase/2-hydroxyglutaryl-CoA dehydratase subunit BcrC/BadD/HgdB